MTKGVLREEESEEGLSEILYRRTGITYEVKWVDKPEMEGDIRILHENPWDRCGGNWRKETVFTWGISCPFRGMLSNPSATMGQGMRSQQRS